MSCGTGEETVKVEPVMNALDQTSGERTRASSVRLSIGLLIHGDPAEP